MAQSATTVTAPNPTPPTNFMAGYNNTWPSGQGDKPPSADFAATVWNDPWHPGNTGTAWLATHPAYPSGVTDSTAPPYLDDGSATSTVVFGAPASGTAHEGAGTETLSTGAGSGAVGAPTYGYGPLVLVPGHAASYLPTGQTPAWSAGDPGGPLRADGCGPALSAGVMPTPNASHPSNLFPATNPTLTSITVGSSVSGVGTTTLSCTGTGFTTASKIYVNGVLYPTTFTSATSIAVTAPGITKKTTASPPTWPVVVVTGPVVTAAQTITWS
jgi:hypothetical protein